MITYYIKNGDRRIFNPGFSGGFIRLNTTDHVRIVGISKEKDGLPGPPVEIPIGDQQGVFVEDIYANSLHMIPLSEQTGKCILENIDSSGRVVNTIEYQTISCPLILDCDADRDGIVGYNEEGKANWTWDSKGRGAILMVNNDKDKLDESPFSQSSEYAELLVRSTGYNEDTWKKLGVELRLYATPLAVNRFAVYRVKPDGKLEKVLPDDPPGNDGGERNISKVLSHNGERLLVEAHQYPGQCPHTEEIHPGICWDSHFEGLITIELHLRLKGADTPRGILLASDRVVFRVAPWIMIPYTMPVKRVYACEIKEPNYSNEEFIYQLEKQLKDLPNEKGELGIPLTSVPESVNPSRDTWIQDQIEIGYSQGTCHHIHVVFDSPRKNDLDIEKIKGQGDIFPESNNKKFSLENVGYFKMAGSDPNTLDSFGNLEVSPPVTVRGKYYPLGRIIFGGRSYGSLAPQSREMMQKIRRFLYAQKVQSPIEVFTDWLEVGHVDEIICFIPNSSPPLPGEKEFKVLLASPARTHALLKTLQAEGHGNKVILKDKKYMDGDGSRQDITVERLLGDKQFWEVNMVYQEHMDLNRAILTKHLGLQHNDFIEIPVIFEVRTPPKERTWAYFPSMVNHLVIEHVSIVPKPHGPKININGETKCAFEEAFSNSMPKGHRCIFIDDWYSFQIKLGGIHCGTNVLRVPPLDVKWWNTLPDEGFNV